MQSASEQIVAITTNDTANKTFIEFPSINFWSSNKTGNYWSDYTGMDNNGDGICDSPYVIDENNQDNYALMVQNAIPDFDYDKETNLSDMLVILIAVAFGLTIIIVTGLLRKKKRIAE